MTPGGNESGFRFATWRATMRTQGGYAAFIAGAVFAIVAQLLPFAFLGDELGLDLRNVDPYRLSSATNSGGMLVGFFAFLSGLTWAAVAYTADQRTNHVYALSLPIERWRYALLRWSVGIAHVVVCSTVFHVTALVLSAVITLPVALRAYPGALTVRFTLASLLTFSLVFGLFTLALNVPQHRRRAAVIALMGLSVVMVALVFAYPGGGVVVAHVLKSMTWSPLRFASGTWALFDV